MKHSHSHTTATSEDRTLLARTLRYQRRQQTIEAAVKFSVPGFTPYRLRNVRAMWHAFKACKWPYTQPVCAALDAAKLQPCKS